MKDGLSGTLNTIDPITKNAAVQQASAWCCEPKNITCPQSKGTLTTVRYVGALLESASIMYLHESQKI
ncbi:hypothetical protein F8M41_005047 [Gigaspora margarita]|uniref:Uncharacterized protein n=1 Tax=Gigaspora margarita TaxID=4874 RepID=A0A8H4AXF6_GIGMA|nr:hypothetical protein F8M41_005047 [Gigaspora margarita]